MSKYNLLLKYSEVNELTFTYIKNDVVFFCHGQHHPCTGCSTYNECGAIMFPGISTSELEKFKTDYPERCI